MSIVLKNNKVSLGDLARWSREGRLFAVFDSCDSPTILLKLSQLEVGMVECLFHGDDPELLNVAPYLVHLDESLVDWIVQDLMPEPWGIFLISGEDLRNVKRHLRKFLVVEGPEGELLYFRFYDPRVLPLFLETCSREQVREFFGLALGLGYMKDGEVYILQAAS